jgi:hypothetical protein
MCISIAAPGAGATRASSPCGSALHETGGAALTCRRITQSRARASSAPRDKGVSGGSTKGMRRAFDLRPCRRISAKR